MATLEAIQDRLRRIRELIATAEVAEMLGERARTSELIEHLRWLMENDGVVRALSDTLGETVQLKEQLRRIRDWIVAVANSPDGLVADINETLREPCPLPPQSPSPPSKEP